MKKKIFKVKYFLVICLFFSSMVLGYSQKVDLQNGWKYSKGDNSQWSDPSFDDKSWTNINVGQTWESQGYSGYDGYGWYRAKTVIPSSLKGNTFLKDSIQFVLGRIDDNDQVYLNGKLIGQNGGLPGKFEDNKLSYSIDRIYRLPINDKSILWDKENVISVRVFDGGGGGGMLRGPYYISMADLSDYVEINSNYYTLKFGTPGQVTQSVEVKNNSKKYTFKGKLNIKATQNIYNSKLAKILLDKTVDATIPPSQSFKYTYTAPSMEGEVITYSFIEGTSNSTITKEEKLPYILTPKVELKPKINGAKVFGVRPNSPVLYTIAATGQKPLTFTADKLPSGVSLDKSTGQITGAVSTPGTYVINLTATNKVGKATKEFRLVVGNKIALTPPMGWNSWNCWGLSVDDAKVRKAADVMKSSGLLDHGWSYVNIDDGWEGKRNEKNEILTNSKFPDMKGLCDYVHSQGMKIGIYSSPGPKTCGMYEGSYRVEALDAKSYADWGFDYLKYDWCSYTCTASPNPSLDEFKEPYKVMQKGLEKVNRDIVYSLCQYGMGKVWEWGAEVNGNAWRTTGDIEDSWESMSGIGFSQDAAAPFSKPGNWNDPDMLVVGEVGWGPSLHMTRLTPDEQYTHISLWSLLASPLLIGCDLGKLDEFTYSLLTNDEVLAVNQDPLGKGARRLKNTADYEIWVKELEDGSKAVGLFNIGANDSKVTFDWSLANISGQKTIRDLWRQKDLGKFDKEYSVVVPSHGVRFVKVY